MMHMTETQAPGAAAAAVTESFSIRQVEAQDLSALATMVAALAVVHGGTSTATPEALGRDLLAPGADTWLIAIIGERTGDSLPEGYAVMYRTYDINHAKMEAFLAHLFVVPEARGRGLGAALLHSARDQALAWGCTTLQLRVDAENQKARRFYKSQGMTERARGRLGYTLVWLARNLGFRFRLQVEFVAPPLSGPPSPSGASRSCP